METIRIAVVAVLALYGLASLATDLEFYHLRGETACPALVTKTAP